MPEMPNELFYLLSSEDTYNHAEAEYEYELERHSTNKAVKVAFEAGYAMAVADERERRSVEFKQMFNACTRRPEPTRRLMAEVK